MTQKDRILELLRGSPGRTVTCQEFADNFLYHKLSSRCGELNRDGYKIEYIAPMPNQSCMYGSYRLAFDKDLDIDQTGQIRFQFPLDLPVTAPNLG